MFLKTITLTYVKVNILLGLIKKIYQIYNMTKICRYNKNSLFKSSYS